MRLEIYIFKLNKNHITSIASATPEGVTIIDGQSIGHNQNVS